MKKISFIFLIGSLLSLTSCKEKFKYSFSKTNEYFLYENLKYGSSERNVLDLALPRSNAHKGLIFYIHGGGWISGDKGPYGNTLKNYAKKGYACAAINYRYAGTNGTTGFEILDDIAGALNKVKSQAEEHNIELNSALLSGGSAGGHLSLLYAYACQNKSTIKPTCVVSLSGPTDLIDPNFYNKNAANYQGQINMISKLTGKNITAENFASQYKDVLMALSPNYYVNESTVPTVICHGTADDLVPYSNAVSLDTLLTEKGVEHELVTFNDAGHGLEKDETAKARMDELFEEYVRRYLS